MLHKSAKQGKGIRSWHILLILVLFTLLALPYYVFHSTLPNRTDEPLSEKNKRNRISISGSGVDRQHISDSNKVVKFDEYYNELEKIGSAMSSHHVKHTMDAGVLIHSLQYSVQTEFSLLRHVGALIDEGYSVQMIFTDRKMYRSLADIHKAAPMLNLNIKFQRVTALFIDALMSLEAELLHTKMDIFCVHSHSIMPTVMGVGTILNMHVWHYSAMADDNPSDRPVSTFLAGYDIVLTNTKHEYRTMFALTSKYVEQLVTKRALSVPTFAVAVLPVIPYTSFTDSTSSEKESNNNNNNNNNNYKDTAMIQFRRDQGRGSAHRLGPASGFQRGRGQRVLSATAPSDRSNSHNRKHVLSFWEISLLEDTEFIESIRQSVQAFARICALRKDLKFIGIISIVVDGLDKEAIANKLNGLVVDSQLQLEREVTFVFDVSSTDIGQLLATKPSIVWVTHVSLMTTKALEGDVSFAIIDEHIVRSMLASCVPIVVVDRQYWGDIDIVQHEYNGVFVSSYEELAQVTLLLLQDLDSKGTKNSLIFKMGDRGRFATTQLYDLSHYQSNLGTLYKRSIKAWPLRAYSTETLPVFRRSTHAMKLPRSSPHMAMVVETTIHGMFELCVRNVLHHLRTHDSDSSRGQKPAPLIEWGLYVFHSVENERFVKLALADIENVNFIQLNVSISNLLDYSRLLKSESFWQQMQPAKKILLFQSDSIMLRSGIDAYMDYDYVGAPWNLDKNAGIRRQIRKGVNLTSVGNGGFSLRSLDAMIQVAAQFAADSPLVHPEDYFFVRYMNQLEYKIPPEPIAYAFCRELGVSKYDSSRSSNNSSSQHLALHAAWYYTDSDESAFLLLNGTYY